MKKYNISEISIWVFSFFLYVSVGFFLSFSLNYIYGDALSRTFHAYTVFFGNEPKLSAIGFVWPPLPTLLQFPLVLVAPLNIHGFSGNLLSAIFMAFSALYIYKILLYWKLPSKFTISLIIFYIINPMIIFYGSNGMSEAIEIFFFTAIIYYFIKYYDNPKSNYLILMSFLTALGIMSRYEILIIIPLLSFILSSYLFFKTSKNENPFKKIESTLIIYNFPIFFILVFWLFANWAILGDPFYFMTSSYSNNAQSQQNLQESAQYQALYHNIELTVIYFFQRLFNLYPIFLISLTGILLLIKGKPKLLPLSLISLSLSLLFFHFILLLSGQSFGWLRFFIPIIPSAIILSGYIIFAYSQRIKFLFILLLFAYTYSTLQSFLAMNNKYLGKEEYHIANALFYKDLDRIENSEIVQETLMNKKIGEYIRKKNYKKKILIDDFTGFGIIYFTGDTKYFVETIDKNFKTTLENISSHKEVGYILTTRPERIGKLDAINIKYPNLFKNGETFTTLEKDFGKWKLYKIN